VSDPLVAAFTEALAKPAGPIPASFAEDYAVELAAIARRVIADEAAPAFTDLIDSSSLGTPEARRLRNETPPEVRAEILDRLGEGEGSDA
jgi:hypothetical protein